jgi:hypothetical protein
VLFPGIGSDQPREALTMFDRISASWDLARSSWQVLKTDSKLVLFPILSAVGTVIVLVSFLVPIGLFTNWQQFAAANNNGRIQVQPYWYAIAFAFYFCNYFVIVFCNSALVSCAIMHFNGKKPTLADGFNAAIARLPQILAWSLVSATVGVLLKAIENANEKVGSIISALLGTAWTVMTIFVVPVLVVEKVGPFDAISRSIAILKKTWGEGLVGRATIGLVMFLFALPGIAVIVAGGMLAANVGLIGVALIALGILYLLALSVIGSALQGIFLGALYQYAAFGVVPTGYDAEVLENAYRRKRS